MTQKFSRTRQRAEAAFSKVQSPFFSKNEAAAEESFIAEARDAKTLRLREARLAKQAEDVANATNGLIRKRADAS